MLPLVLLRLLVLGLIASAARGLSPPRSLTRRAHLTRLIGGAGAAALAAPRDARAIPFFLPEAAPKRRADFDPAVFVGRYTDPKHPGGTREVVLKDLVLTGGNRIAKVRGGGGQGEPADYELPAVVAQCGNLIGKWVPPPGEDPAACIRIDFGPKGGPRNFIGYWDGTGIKFPLDGNKWPRVSGS